MKGLLHLRLPALAACIAALAAACSTKEPTKSTYFERTISPILTTSCVRTNTGAGCHVADARGNALGNLDAASYEGVLKRKDLLLDYGPYGQPGFLLKNVAPSQIEVQGYDGVKSVITTDIKHAGGSILDPTGTAYQTLRRWIQNGTTENNTGPAPTNIERLPCSTFVPGRADFDLGTDPARPDFATFRDRVNGLLSGTADDDGLKKLACAASNCHGNLSNSLYLTCGSTPEQLRWNYLAAQEYLAQTPEQSELLRRPLAPAQGGAYHEGGIMFSSPADEGYRRLEEWARQHGPATATDDDGPGFAFFAHKVQPVLVKKGCMMMQCHSASMFHDYRLRGGSAGSFSLSATRQNYELSLAQMSIESEDPNASRLVRKNLYRPEVCGVAGCDKPAGIAHRGGPLFEDFGAERASPEACAAGNHDYDNGDLDKIPAYCVILEWLKRERDLHKLAPLSGIVYVKRPIGSLTRAQDFDVYAPGADLRRVDTTIASGALGVTDGTDKSLTAGCGLDPRTADIRRPQVSWDGTRVAFAARSSASEPLAVYEMNADGSSCSKHPGINTTPPSENGLLVHNFDPTYAPPDGGFSRIVFASTRGNLSNAAYDYQGPQRTPADPTKPNSNLYVLEPNPAAPAQTRVRQLTFLLNMERQPSFMNDGRIIFTAEKRAPGFYQLSLRRLNLDTGDYHPLYAQRGSIGFPEATQVVELADKDFATIFSVQASPGGAGTLGVFNRSIGIDFTSSDPADYPVDPGVLDPAQLQAPDPAFFLRSLRFPDRAANPRPGQPTSGFYTSPAALPSTSLLVSFDPGGGDYDVYVMEPGSGAKTKLFGDPSSAEVDAVAVYARFPRRIYRSRLDEPNGHVLMFEDKQEAEIHVLDFHVLASLLFQNTPTGRQIDPDISTFNVYEDMPPPLEVDSMDKGGTFVANDAFGRVYVRRRLLGTAAVEADGSTKLSVPGGVPIVLELPPTKLSQEKGLPRVQREAMSFSPGEYAHQSFRANLFDGLCGQCHGSISGRPIDAALQPDFVTQASSTLSRFKGSFDMNKPPAARGAITGPPATP
ncbi:MAG: hypothetical protein BGO98_34440 [Myxococcales bacterium 68-20]|nr:hypothetical protein [Myxococcales bacterium]OJY25720.1 MAG: hypothetical protein BGO98_34440 [Myxococcales bacterium 68-20]